MAQLFDGFIMVCTPIATKPPASAGWIIKHIKYIILKSKNKHAGRDPTGDGCIFELCDFGFISISAYQYLSVRRTDLESIASYLQNTVFIYDGSKVWVVNYWRCLAAISILSERLKAQRCFNIV